MPFEVDVNFDLPDGFCHVCTAEDLLEAESVAVAYVKDTYPDAKNIEVEAVREVR